MLLTSFLGGCFLGQKNPLLRFSVEANGYGKGVFTNKIPKKDGRRYGTSDQGNKRAKSSRV